MSVELTYIANLTAKETLETNMPAASATKAVVTHDAWNTTHTSTTLGALTPAIATTKVAAFDQALTAGAATIDLENLVGTNGAAVVGTGLRIQAMKLRGATANADPVTITQGAANGYDGFGASFSITLEPDAEVLILTQDAGANISATNSDLDVSGPGTEEIEVEIILG